ncbi:MAG: endonuclease domain-containing protein [Hoeflea sp.]|uniref:endonuclease domain-containing protein n=1 Tax=Hoeflea sp. TaxID=1940281 RepID=UPI00272FDEC6|nr:endonuclease domain-containing protein [Hoeflea sp.]MDP2118801.1 endonuclease domain-containing protein [Hoeflea sp.]
MAAKPMPATKTLARQMRKQPTDAEHLLWRELRNRLLNGFRFSRQVRVGPYICDFCCRSEKLVVELDGSQHALNESGDQRRTEWLKRNGYSVLRFWHDEIVFERGAVLDTILAALEGRLEPPHPTQASAQLRFAVPSYPSPRRGEGANHRLHRGDQP